MTSLSGVGIGRGIAIGPILRMPEPLPEPSDAASTITADAEKVRAVASLAATAADIRLRGERAGVAVRPGCRQLGSGRAADQG